MLRITNNTLNNIATETYYDMFNLLCLEEMGNFYHILKSSAKIKASTMLT